MTDTRDITLNGEGQPWKAGDLFRVVRDSTRSGTEVGDVFAVDGVFGGHVFFIDREGNRRSWPLRWVEPVHKVTPVEPLVVGPAPGEWIGFNGGQCPVDGDVLVDILFKNDVRQTSPASQPVWAEVAAYRIAEPAKPREWWIDPDNLEVYETPFTPFLVHVRPVTR